ncbi:MAG: hypothetical protein AB1540_14315 [Bdellovibrionota bacterium]
MNDGTQNRLYNVSVIDGKNQYVNAGLSFTRRPDLDFIHAALAKRALQWLSFGASLKRFSSYSNSRAAAGGSVNGFDGGLSASIAFPPSLISTPIQLGFTADNLMHSSKDEPYVGPRQLGAGVKVTLREMLMLYGDIVENYSHFTGAYPIYSAGAEISLGADFYARGGLFGFRESGWSFGGGWVGPRMGVSYGYQNRQVRADRSYQHAVTMDIFM